MLVAEIDEKSHSLCISAYGQGESCTVLLWNDGILQWPQLGQFLINISSLLMKSTLELSLGFGACFIKSVLSLCVKWFYLSA